MPPDARPISKLKRRTEGNTPSKLVLRKRRNEVPQAHVGGRLEPCLAKCGFLHDEAGRGFGVGLVVKTRNLQVNSSTGPCPQLKAGPTKPDNTQSGHVEIREVDIVFLLHLRFSKGQFN